MSMSHEIRSGKNYYRNIAKALDKVIIFLADLLDFIAHMIQVNRLRQTYEVNSPVRKLRCTKALSDVNLIRMTNERQNIVFSDKYM